MIHYDMPFEEYKAMSGVNASLLKDVMDRGAAKALAGKPERDSDALAAGTAIHVASLEPESFSLLHARFEDEEIKKKCVTKDGSLAKNPKLTSEYKAAYKKCEDDNPGKRVLSANEYDIYLHCGRLARRHIPAATKNEITVTWTRHALIWDEPAREQKKAGIDRLNEEYVPVECKGRLDAVDFDMFVLYDLKTTGDTKRIRSDAYDLRYHCQLAWYLEGLQVHYPGPWRVELVVVQQDGTDAQSFPILPCRLDMGLEEFDRALSALECTRRGKRGLESKWAYKPDNMPLEPLPYYKPYGVYA